MAVRPSDWNPGEILTASDLNDSLASKSDKDSPVFENQITIEDGFDNCVIYAQGDHYLRTGTPSSYVDNFRLIGSTGRLVGAGESLGPWTAYTPSLTASTTNPTLGGGASAGGAWVAIGRVVIYRFAITFGGAGAAAGSGIYRVSLPRPPANTNNIIPVGECWLYDSNLATSRVAGLFIEGASPGYAIIRADNVIAVNEVSPWTWASGDTIAGTLVYEEAV